MEDYNLLRFIHFASRTTKIKLGIVFLTGTFIVTGTLFTLSTLWKIYKGSVPVHEETLREPAAIFHEEALKTYEIKGISVGFMDRKDSRMAYSQFTLVFNCADEPCKKNLLLNHAKVLDTIFEVSSNFYVEDFVHPEANKGFSKLKSKLTEDLQKKFADLAPKGVVIQDWFMN